MSQHPLATMSEAAFDALIEAHITRIAAGGDALPLEVLIALWFERRDAASAVVNTTATDAGKAAPTRGDDTQGRSREDTNDGD